MVELILKSLFIGFLSSAPMGPVGMLCVQRTLNDGRKSGLLTGAGAAVGDIIIATVAMIAALGLGFNTEFIQEHQWPLQMFGSIVIIVFGIAVFRKNPSKNITHIKDLEVSGWKLFISSLFLTISNILVLFLYIGLFARFNLINASNPFGYNLAGILFIGVGAMLWWFFISYMVNKLRGALNPRGLKAFNRVVGSILIIVGAVGIVTAIASVNLFG